MRQLAIGMSSVRRKRRQRGKRKEARRQELKEQARTWDRLANGIDTKQDFASVILPLIRHLTPNMIAQEIVGVQPMNVLDPDKKWNFKYEYYDSKQEKKARKAKKRAAKQEKRARRFMEKIMQDFKAQK